MSVSRRLLLFALTVPVAGVPIGLPSAAARAQQADAPAAIRRLCGALLAAMKAGRRQSFQQRYDSLAPTIGATFDLPLMSRIAVGPEWAKLPPDQQQRLSEAFARYTIATYANRFGDYGGERFEVDPTPSANPNGVVVRSAIVKSNGDKVALDYLMRKGADGVPKVIDVYLSGSISQLASLRSEFVAVLQRDGADGLVRLLERRAAPGAAS